MSQGDQSLGRKGAQVARWSGQKASERGEFEPCSEQGTASAPHIPGDGIWGAAPSTVTDKGMVTDVGHRRQTLVLGPVPGAVISFMFSGGRDGNQGWL